MADLKLFVWEDALWDYTPGMIVALAPDLETAMEIMRNHPIYGLWADEMSKPHMTIDLTAEKIPATVWAVHGGG